MMNESKGVLRRSMICQQCGKRLNKNKGNCII